MKYLIISIFFLLTSIASAENSGQKNPIEINYTLNLNFDKTSQKIIIYFHNKSVTDFRIRREFSPFSPPPLGISLFTFNDSENLLPAEMYYAIDDMIGLEPDIITIPANKYFRGDIRLKDFMFDYCGTLNKNPILILWSYSHYDDDYTLPQKEGLLRIKRSDVKCDK